MNFYFFTYLFLAMLGLHCCVGFSLVAAHGLLIVLASLIVTLWLQCTGSIVCGAWD